MRACLILFAALLLQSNSLFSQESPYDNPPSVEPPYYRVRYEASTEPGELIFPVSYTVWIPAGVETLRGVIVHQHGCGEGSCKSGQSGAFDLHWQALARKHACALLAPSYEQPQAADCQMWCDPRNGSDVAFQRALVDLGASSGHPELASVPWALWGHSGGGHWAGGMLLLHPDRTAAVWLRSGVPLFEPVEGRAIKPHALPAAALEVPVMCNLGTKEGVTVKEGRFARVWPANQQFFSRMRGQGALIAIAVDPLTSHECGNQRYLAIPWFDACLTARLSPDGGALQPIAESDGWVAPLQAGIAEQTAAVPANKFKSDLAKSVWLPTKPVAKAWLQFVRDTEVADTTPPPVPSNLRIENDQLTWDAVGDLQSGIAQFIIERDGREIARVPREPTNRFGRPLFQGLQYSDTPTVPLVEMKYPLAETDPTDASRYRVRSVNTVGLVSP